MGRGDAYPTRMLNVRQSHSFQRGQSGTHDGGVECARQSHHGIKSPAAYNVEKKSPDRGGPGLKGIGELRYTHYAIQ